MCLQIDSSFVDPCFSLRLKKKTDVKFERFAGEYKIHFFGVHMDINPVTKAENLRNCTTNCDLNYVAVNHAKVNHCFRANTLSDFFTKLLCSCTFICMKHHVFEQYMLPVCVLSGLVIKLLNIR